MMISLRVSGLKAETGAAKRAASTRAAAAIRIIGFMGTSRGGPPLSRTVLEYKMVARPYRFFLVQFQPIVNEMAHIARGPYRAVNCA